jgi:hypothetical protein
MRYQRQSEVPKKGAPDDHELAVLFTINYLDTIAPELDCSTTESFWFPPDFCKERGILYDEHTPDLTIRKVDNHFDFITIAVVEFDGKTDYKIELEDGTIIKGKRTRHDKPEQKIRDGIFMDYMAQYHPKVKVIRIEKADAFNKSHLDKTFKAAGLIK